MKTTQPPHRAADSSAPVPETGLLPPSPRPGRCWRSEELLGSDAEVRIDHGDLVYRLRRTAQGKLILTK